MIGPHHHQTRPGGAHPISRRRPRPVSSTVVPPTNGNYDYVGRDAATVPFVNDDDLFEFDAGAFLTLGVVRAVRPLPSAATMAAAPPPSSVARVGGGDDDIPRDSWEARPTATATAPSMPPLLRSFVASVTRLRDGERDESSEARGGAGARLAESISGVAQAEEDEDEGVEVETKTTTTTHRHRRTNNAVDETAVADAATTMKTTAAMATAAAPYDNGGAAKRDDEDAFNREVHGQNAAVATTTEERNGRKRTAASALDPLDDPANSMLTRGRHDRYRRLLDEMGRGRVLDGNKWKEFRRLRDAVRQERLRYRDAVAAFREGNVDRFLIGFKAPGPASSFVNSKGSWIGRYRNQWTASQQPNEYGRCSQCVSLQMVSASRSESSILPYEYEHDARSREAPSPNKGQRKMLDVDSFAPSIVAVNGEVSAGRLKAGWMEGLPAGTKLPSPKFPCAACAAATTLLCNDEIAKRVASENDARIIISSDALAALLRRSGHESTRWIIPLCILAGGEAEAASSSRRASAVSRPTVFVEDPIPRPSTPRECLSFGFGSSLREAVLGYQSKPPLPTTVTNVSVQYVYTLLTIPPSNLKVVVRSVNDFLDEHGKPMRLLAHLEYFPERGEEEYSAHERAVWIMEKMLQPECRTVVARVDPNTASLLKWEEKSVAHALACADGLDERDRTPSTLSDFDPPAHFQGAAHTLRAMCSVGVGRHVMCLPGRGITPQSLAATSVSVHKACSEAERRKGKPDDLFVDMEKELEEADAVFMSKGSLMTCFRPWIWKDVGRLAYTFPIGDEDE